MSGKFPYKATKSKKKAEKANESSSSESENEYKNRAVFIVNPDEIDGEKNENHHGVIVQKIQEKMGKNEENNNNNEQKQEETENDEEISIDKLSDFEDIESNFGTTEANFGTSEAISGTGFVFGEIVKDIEEDSKTEFKSLLEAKDVPTSIADYAKKYVCAFLNARGGRIFFGIQNNGRVHGILMNRQLKDEIRLKIDVALNNMRPSVDPHLCRVRFLKVSPPIGKREQIGKERFVVEITVAEGRAPVYFCSKTKNIAYWRRDASTVQMESDSILERQRFGRPKLVASDEVIENVPEEFVGRESEMTEALSMINSDAQRSQIYVLSISGEPFVGKSSFARNLVHVSSNLYHDGLYYIEASDRHGGYKSVEEIMSAIIRVRHPNSAPGVVGTSTSNLDLGAVTAQQLRRQYNQCFDGCSSMILLESANAALVSDLIPDFSMGKLLICVTTRKMISSSDFSEHIGFGSIHLPPLKLADSVALIKRLLRDAAQPGKARRISANETPTLQGHPSTMHPPGLSLGASAGAESSSLIALAKRSHSSMFLGIPNAELGRTSSFNPPSTTASQGVCVAPSPAISTRAPSPAVAAVSAAPVPVSNSSSSSGSGNQVNLDFEESCKRLAMECGNLPLIIRLVVGSLSRRSNLTIDDLVRKMAGDESLPDAKILGDLPSKTLNILYEEMEANTRKLFDSVCVFPRTFDAAAAMAVFELDYEGTIDALGELIEHYLVYYDSSTMRYSMNHFVRKFANMRLKATDPAQLEKLRMRLLVHFEGMMFPHGKLLPVEMHALYLNEVVNIKAALHYAVQYKKFRSAWRLATVRIVGEERVDSIPWVEEEFVSQCSWCA